MNKHRNAKIPGQTKILQLISEFCPVAWLIDSYVKKHDNDMLAKLRSKIEKHRLAFFRGKSAFIWHSLSIFSGESNEVQNSYCKLVEAIHKHYHATEYYLFDQNGSYRFFNNDGEQIDLIIKTREQLESELDASQERITESHLFEKLKTFEVMLSPGHHNEYRVLSITPLNSEHSLFFGIEKSKSIGLKCSS